MDRILARCKSCGAANEQVADVIPDGSKLVARVRYPDGSGQVITGKYESDPHELARLLRDWLAKHIHEVEKDT